MEETIYAQIKRRKPHYHRPVEEQRLFRLECKRPSEFRRWPHFTPVAFASREEARTFAQQSGYVLVRTWAEAEEADAKERAKAADLGPCRWFARCDRDATHLEPHPTLGPTPSCDRCAEIGR